MKYTNLVIEIKGRFCKFTTFAKLTSFLLCICLLFSLAACDSATEERGTPDAGAVADETPEENPDKAELPEEEIPDETTDEDEPPLVPSEPSPYEGLSFDTSLFSYLGQPAADVAAALDSTGEWEYVYDESGTPNPRPNRIEPLVVDGAEYDYYMRLNSSAEAWGISFERALSVSADDKTEELQKVYDLLVSELGEPEELDGALSVGDALEGELANREQYTEWWILDEDYEMAFDPDLDVVLTCHLTVNYQSPSLSIGVHYALYQPSALYEIARYRESGVAKHPMM